MTETRIQQYFFTGVFIYNNMNKKIEFFCEMQYGFIDIFSVIKFQFQ